jgi:hypothetical protein
MRTMNQQLACSFRCARHTLHGFIELIRAWLSLHRNAVIHSVHTQSLVVVCPLNVNDVFFCAIDKTQHIILLLLRYSEFSQCCLDMSDKYLPVIPGDTHAPV